MYLSATRQTTFELDSTAEVYQTEEEKRNIVHCVYTTAKYKNLCS